MLKSAFLVVMSLITIVVCVVPACAQSLPIGDLIGNSHGSWISYAFMGLMVVGFLTKIVGFFRKVTGTTSKTKPGKSFEGLENFSDDAIDPSEIDAMLERHKLREQAMDSSSASLQPRLEQITLNTQRPITPKPEVTSFGKRAAFGKR